MRYMNHLNINLYPTYFLTNDKRMPYVIACGYIPYLYHVIVSCISS